MKRKLLFTLITTILLVPHHGVQVLAQYTLPDNEGTVTMSDILKKNPSLKGKPIYGDIQRDKNGNPSTPVTICGGIDKNKNSLLNDSNRYGKDNPGITFKIDSCNGLTLTSKTGQPIEKAILYLAIYKKDNCDWWKDTTSITLEHNNKVADLNNSSEEDSDTTEAAKTVVPEPDPKFCPWWVWLLVGFLIGVVLSFILRKTIASQTKKTTDEDKQACNFVKLPTSEEKVLSKGEVDQIVDRIAEKYSSELFAKLSKLVDEKINSSGTEKKTQNNTSPNVIIPNRSVKEIREVQKEETEIFCGYAQLPQNGDFALTLTQDPARTAFVISKRGSDYFVDLIKDKQILSQLIQPLSALKANGSNIVDFPEGELKGAQKIVCVDRGIFREESAGRIIPVKPIQIKRG